MMRASHRTGAALILVLWAIAVLSLVAGGLSFAIRQDLAIANIERDRIVAHCLARAGVEQAIASVVDDAASFDASDSLIDTWCDDPLAMQQIELTGGSFSVIADGHEPTSTPWYGASDESAKLNINVATREQLLKLPDMTEPIAAAIIDWRDRDEEAEPDGIERGHYASLAHPYEIRNGAFRTVRELLLVRGVTPELFYGEDRNVNGLLETNEDDGTTSEPDDNGDGRLDRGWYAYVTIYSYEKNVNGTGEDRLKLNKASEQELTTRLHLESWAAKSIIKAREKKKFEHLVDLLDVKRDPSIRRDADAEDEYYFRADDEQDQPVTQTIFQQIVDDLTLKDEQILWGRINVNTAPEVVLNTLPGMDEDLAETIVRDRDARGGYTSIGQLLDVKGVTKETFGKFEEAITVRSNVFRIWSQGDAASGLAQATIECVVDRSGDAPRVLYWLESSP